MLQKYVLPLVVAFAFLGLAVGKFKAAPPELFEEASDPTESVELVAHVGPPGPPGLPTKPGEVKCLGFIYLNQHNMQQEYDVATKFLVNGVPPTQRQLEDGMVIVSGDVITAMGCNVGGLAEVWSANVTRYSVDKSVSTPTAYGKYFPGYSSASWRITWDCAPDKQLLIFTQGLTVTHCQTDHTVLPQNQ